MVEIKGKRVKEGYLARALKDIERALMEITKEIRRQDAVTSANSIISRFIMSEVQRD